jgi:hypothetical protein
MTEEKEPYTHLLNVTESGYGREQVLLLALRLACRDLLGIAQSRGREWRAEDEAMVEFISEASNKLDAHPEDE